MESTPPTKNISNKRILKKKKVEVETFLEEPVVEKVEKKKKTKKQIVEEPVLEESVKVEKKRKTTKKQIVEEPVVEDVEKKKRTNPYATFVKENYAKVEGVNAQDKMRSLGALWRSRNS